MIAVVDPGGTSGIAIAHDNEITTTTYTTPKELYELIDQLTPDDIVVCEDFQTSNNISKYGLYTVRLIGAIEAITTLHHVPLYMQMPQYRYSSRIHMEQFIKEHPRKPTYVIHERDALMHLFAFVEKGNYGELAGTMRKYMGKGLHA